MLVLKIEKILKKMPKAGIEPASPRPQRGVLTTILLGPKVILYNSLKVIHF